MNPRVLIEEEVLCQKKTITNSKGQQISLEKYDYVDFEEFVNGYAIVGKKGKEGFINESGELICHLKYDTVWPFRETYTSNGKRILNASKKEILEMLEHDELPKIL